MCARGTVPSPFHTEFAIEQCARCENIRISELLSTLFPFVVAVGNRWFVLRWQKHYITFHHHLDDSSIGIHVPRKSIFEMCPDKCKMQIEAHCCWQDDYANMWIIFVNNRSNMWQNWHRQMTDIFSPTCQFQHTWMFSIFWMIYFVFFSNSQTLSVSNAVTDNNVNELFRLRRFVFINACVVCCPSTKSKNENELQNLCKRWTPHASKQRNSIEMVTFISGIRYLFDMEQYFLFFSYFRKWIYQSYFALSL